MNTTPAPDPDAPGRRDATRAGAGAGVEAGTVRTNDLETYYERRGRGPPIVFVHGMAMSSAEREPQVAALAGEFTTVAYDVRGHGHTGGSGRTSYSMDLYAEDLDALLAALDIERPVVCGLSMGGCIAQAYAATYPENVTGLVLADTFTAAPVPFAGRLLFANLRVMGLLDRVVRYTTLNRVQTWIGDRLVPGIAGDGVTTQRLMESAPLISHTEFRKIARSVADFPSSGFDASRITCPALIVHGEHVPATLRVVHDRLAAALANADVQRAVVPDVDASNVDNAFFTDRVARFARDVFGD